MPPGSRQLQRWRCSLVRSSRSERWFRLGFVTDLISKPVRLGYLAGIAVTVLVTQLPVLLGIQISADSLVETVSELPTRSERPMRRRSRSARRP